MPPYMMLLTWIDSIALFYLLHPPFQAINPEGFLCFIPLRLLYKTYLKVNNILREKTF